MHIVYSNGLLGSTLMLFLRECEEHHGIYYPCFEKFFQQPWHFPDSHTMPAEIFNKNRQNTSHDAVKAMASELLTVYPGIRHWVETHSILSMCGQIQGAREALMALFDVCDTLEEARITFGEAMRPLAAQLKVQIRTYMITFVAAHGRDAVKPKHHELLHVPF